MRLKRDGTREKTRFRLSAKRMSPFKSAGRSVQSTTGSRGVRISGSNAGYNMFRGSVKSNGYPLHLPVSPSLPLPASPCAITFQLESTALYTDRFPYNSVRMQRPFPTMLFSCLKKIWWTNIKSTPVTCKDNIVPGC